MRGRTTAVLAISGGLMAAALPALAQQDEGPILRPKTAAQTGGEHHAAGDVRSGLQLEAGGEARGRIEAGSSGQSEGRTASTLWLP